MTKAHLNMLTIATWLKGRPHATLAQIAKATGLDRRATSYAIQYGVRTDVVKRVDDDDLNGNAQYTLTGKEPGNTRSQRGESSFDHLLSAWGIALTPPQLPVLDSRLVLAGD
ncbi:hypothetical protein [Burkholderia gladioli]|uniref:hypothetical protein n=1 Tax=Burkholderia gladioli TaxID=28095 RepID=UPI001641DAD7|nr:hypothetical protein [Burkholderia gladioli]